MIHPDVLVAGAGTPGRTLAERLEAQGLAVTLLDKDPAQGASVGLAGDVLLTDDTGRAAGLQVIRGVGEREILRARAVVLATGGVGGLYPTGPEHETGDGLVLAQRAGATVEPRLAWGTGDVPRLERGVVTDDVGRTGVPGLYAVGELAGGVEADAAADALAQELQEGPEEAPSVGGVHMAPDIDSPLPEGFTRVKMKRLRELATQHLGPDGPRDPERARTHLHRLKGEADAFGRARLDPGLWSFRFATEAAILLLKHADAPA